MILCFQYFKYYLIKLINSLFNINIIIYMLHNINNNMKNKKVAILQYQ